jgi:hypothetical protein
MIPAQLRAALTHLPKVDVDIILKLHETRSYSATSTALGLTMGRLRHRLFNSVHVTKEVSPSTADAIEAVHKAATMGP